MLVAAPIGAHAAEQPTAPEATPAPAHFAEPVAAAINESAAVFAAPEPAAPAFPIAPAYRGCARVYAGARGGAIPRGRPCTQGPAACARKRVRCRGRARRPVAKHTRAVALCDARAYRPPARKTTSRPPARPKSPAPRTPAIPNQTPRPTPSLPVTQPRSTLPPLRPSSKTPGSTMSFEPLTEERIETDSTYDAGTTTQLMWGARSDVGCVRPHNEDSYLVQSPLLLRMRRHGRSRRRRGSHLPSPSRLLPRRPRSPPTPHAWPQPSRQPTPP